MDPNYTPRTARLVERLQILPQGQYSDVAPIVQMTSGISLVFYLGTMKRDIDERKLKNQVSNWKQN